MANQIINPFTKICRYDSISRRVNTAIIGNIGGTLFDTDKEAKARFYKSKIGRKNKEIISELVSELYTFINRLLSEYSNPESYWFRISFVMEIDNEKGNILTKPLFDVDLFKHMGQISGKQSDDSKKNINVLLLDIGKTKLSKHIHASLMLVKNNVPIVNYAVYKEHHKIPEKIRGIVETEQSYIVIDDTPFSIKYELVDNIIYYYIMDGKIKKSFNDEKEVFGFILSKLDNDPEISSGGTAFQYSEGEVKKLEDTVRELSVDANYGREITNKLIDELNKDFEEFDELREKLLARIRMRKVYRERRDKLIRSYMGLKDDFIKRRIDFYSASEMMHVFDEKHEEGALSDDVWGTAKFRHTKILHRTGGLIIDIHTEMRNKIMPEFNFLNEKIFKKKSKAKVKKK